VKRKIALSLLVLFLFFTFGATISTLYITRTTSEMNRLIKLHQIENLRRSLVISIQTVQSDLYAINTPFKRNLNSIITHVTDLEKSAKACTACHHSSEVSVQLDEIQLLIHDYQEALSYYITASANVERIRNLAMEASAIGNKILIYTEEMSMAASRHLARITDNAMKKIYQVKIILLITILSTFILGLLVSIRLTRSITRPVNELLDATRIIASGSLGHKISYEDKTELGELARNFNIMSESLEEKSKLEEQLRHAQKMEAIGTLTAGISHEYNNIMTSIMGFGEFLYEYTEEGSTERQHVDHIIASAERAAKLTEGLLAYSRKQLVNIEPININDVLRTMDQFLSNIVGENIELKVSSTDNDLIVLADKSQIEQIIMNLATNAMDAMPRGGTLTISSERLEYEEAPPIHQSDLEPGSYVLLSITDSGVGIDKEIQSKIFEPFYTTKEIGKGTGLGLSMVYGIVRKHNGHTYVESDPGEGTTFRIYLPLSESRVPTERSLSHSAREDGNETVLIAEDDEMLKELLINSLEKAGYNVLAAKDGETAVKHYQNHGNEIDLLLFDVSMPKKDGKSAYEEIRDTNPDVKIIFISGYGTIDDDRTRSILDEGHILLKKPVRPKEILKKIRKVLG
jgi:signal transduction histidine kinase